MRACVLAFAVVVASLPARGEEPRAEPAGQDAPADPKLQEELERALQADQKTQEKPQETPKAETPPAGGARSFQSLNPDLSLIADFALAAFSDPAPRMSGGHDPTGNGFNLQAVELALGTAVDPYFRADANLAFNPAG